MFSENPVDPEGARHWLAAFPWLVHTDEQVARGSAHAPMTIPPRAQRNSERLLGFAEDLLRESFTEQEWENAQILRYQADSSACVLNTTQADKRGPPPAELLPAVIALAQGHFPLVERYGPMRRDQNGAPVYYGLQHSIHTTDLHNPYSGGGRLLRLLALASHRSIGEGSGNLTEVLVGCDDTNYGTSLHQWGFLDVRLRPEGRWQAGTPLDRIKDTLATRVWWQVSATAAPYRSEATLTISPSVATLRRDHERPGEVVRPPVKDLRRTYAPWCLLGAASRGERFLSMESLRANRMRRYLARLPWRHLPLPSWARDGVPFGPGLTRTVGVSGSPTRSVVEAKAALDLLASSPEAFGRPGADIFSPRGTGLLPESGARLCRDLGAPLTGKDLVYVDVGEDLPPPE